jgi:hypothetical protein
MGISGFLMKGIIKLVEFKKDAGEEKRLDLRKKTCELREEAETLVEYMGTDLSKEGVWRLEGVLLS